MRIAIDLRSLSSGSVSGVENYTLNLLERLLSLDNKNQYVLFYNSFKDFKVPDFHFVNSQVKATKYPNKLLNLGLMAGAIKIEKLIGDFDCLFMPNLNQFNIQSGKKLVLTVHDLSPAVTPEFYDLKRNLWHKLLGYKRAFTRANLIFAVSEYTKKDLVRLYGIEEKKIKVVYPGIDHKEFTPDIPAAKLREARNVYGLPGDYILFLNTIEPRKNLVNLIKAFEVLDNPAELVIAGRKGWKYRSIFRAIKQSKKRDKIRYIGYVPESDKSAIIKLARALVYPSFYEGFGFQPLEAMAVGTPAVVSQVTALPEVTGNAALLVDPYDINSIAKGVKSILSDDRLRQNLIEKGLQRVKEFTWEKTAKEVLEGIERLKD